MQCTKGKCPKAFHVSCARESSAIVFEVKEVEKEVILMDPTAAPMEVDAVVGIPMERNDQVLKVIKKLEVQILCTQHNPVCSHVQEAKNLVLICGPCRPWRQKRRLTNKRKSKRSSWLCQLCLASKYALVPVCLKYH